jgi:hypothetical protein
MWGSSSTTKTVEVVDLACASSCVIRFNERRRHADRGKVRSLVQPRFHLGRREVKQTRSRTAGSPRP